MIQIKVLMFAEMDRSGPMYRQAKLEEMATDGWVIAGVTAVGYVHHVYMQRVIHAEASGERHSERSRQHDIRWVGDPIQAGPAGVAYSGMPGDANVTIFRRRPAPVGGGGNGFGAGGEMYQVRESVGGAGGYGGGGPCPRGSGQETEVNSDCPTFSIGECGGSPGASSQGDT